MPKGKTTKKTHRRRRAAPKPVVKESAVEQPAAPEQEALPGSNEPIVDTFDFDALMSASGESAPPDVAEVPAGSDGHATKQSRRGKRRATRIRPPEVQETEPETQLGTEETAPELESMNKTQAEIPDANLRQQLMRELDDMIGRIRSLNPGYNPPPFSPRALVDLVSQNMDKLPAGFSLQILDKLRESIGTDLFDVDTWKGIWYVLNSTLQSQGDMVKRRLTGDYETDAWGMDQEFREAVLPFFDFMYKTYWRVEMSGLENIPGEGRALLVGNHSGQLPWDGSMIASGILREHPNNRILRPLYATWFPTLPFISDFLVKTGGVLATEDNGERLLEQDQLVLVLPEGYKGVGKLFKDRYRLARFGRGGFVQMALKTRAPMIPVSVVGAEETYISLHKSNTLAKLTGFPYFPISPTFPWFGLLGFVPLPTKWYIDIGAPIPTEGYKQGSENNPVLVSQLTDQVRNIVQEMIYARLAQRRSVFFK